MRTEIIKSNISPSFQQGGLYGRYFKRPMDFILALIAIIVLSPVLLAVAILVRIKLGSPVIFRQKRPGLNEKIFTLYKFRTMTDERNEFGELLPDSMRLTEFGKFLRSTSLDELPELFNVLKGDMSIVGPRPLLVKYLPLYNEHQKRRHDVRPGLSGWAQVNGRNAISWEDKFDLDVEYVNNMSFTMDWKIIFMTLKKVFTREGINQEGEATVEDFKGSFIGVKEDHLETPYFLIDKNELKNNINNLKNALASHWNNYIIGYSFKTNSLPWLVDYLKDEDFYAEVVSDDEYELALMVGYERNKLIYNGPQKTKDTFLEAIKNGCIVNIDSQRELNWLSELNEMNDRKFEVGIRVNFELDRYCPNESAMGVEGGRFGFCYENGELKKAIDYINTLNNVTLAGIHLHCSTRTRSLNIYRTISRIACEIKRIYGLNLKYVDIGGGFFGGLEDKPQFSDYLEVISEELEKEFSRDNTTLIVEPGTSIVSSPFNFVTSVIDIKRTSANNFVVIDGSRINVDPLFGKSRYFFDVKYKDEFIRDNIKTQVISGFTCMEKDRLFKLENYPQLLVGDKIIFKKVGAYTMCLSPLFIKYFPEVYVKDNDNIYKVRERWTAKEYLIKSNI